MTSTTEENVAERLFMCERDVVHLILEFLSSRHLTCSQVQLEKESGVVNDVIPSPDLLFLRSLIRDGRWDDVTEFLQPLEDAFKGFPGRKVRATILKHRFLDILILHVANSTLLLEEPKPAVLENLVKVLNELEGLVESKEEYTSLCVLLTSPTRLAEHQEYKDWNSSTARLTCFNLLRPLVQKFIPPPQAPMQPHPIATSDRLIQLLIKGLLYESCVEYCQSKAMLNDNKGRTSSATADNQIRFSQLLNDNQLSESDLSLISWMRSIPSNIFGCAFQRRSLRVDIEPLPKIQKTLMNVSIMDSASDLLSRSMASTSFHLSSVEPQPTDLKTMTTSVDRLFGDHHFVDSIYQSSSGGAGVHLGVRPEPPKPPGHQYSKTVHSREQMASKESNNISSAAAPHGTTNSKAKFVAVTTLEDIQAVRCAEFHPSGSCYAVGSNSKTLRICSYADLRDLCENHQPYQPTVLFKRIKHHKGSIYCMGWSPDGTLLATGSNDKTVKLLKFDDINNTELLTGSQEVELSMHDGTVRDVCFLEESNNRTSLLVSGGAGDCKIYVTDCATATPFQALSGHTGAILSLYNWGAQIFCSGSQDKTIRFWDLRTRGCVDVVTPLTSTTPNKSPVASVCVEPSGRLLVCGHEDAATVLYDIRGQRQIQCMKSHSADVRSVRFSPAAYYLLSGGYDNNIILSDMQGDLSVQLPSVVVASHQDKCISARWHPSEFTFLTTSADKTVVLWALPPDN